jgi:hypothetical protein
VETSSSRWSDRVQPGDDDDSAPYATPGTLYESNCSDGIDEDWDCDTDCYDGEESALDPACSDDDPGNDFGATDVLRYPNETLIIVEDAEVELIRQWIKEGMVED